MKLAIPLGWWQQPDSIIRELRGSDPIEYRANKDETYDGWVLSAWHPTTNILARVPIHTADTVRDRIYEIRSGTPTMVNKIADAMAMAKDMIDVRMPAFKRLRWHRRTK